MQTHILDTLTNTRLSPRWLSNTQDPLQTKELNTVSLKKHKHYNHVPQTSLNVFRLCNLHMESRLSVFALRTMNKKITKIWCREEIKTIIIMWIILTGPALYANEGNHLPRQARLIAPSLISWINITFLSTRRPAPSGAERVSGRLFGWRTVWHFYQHMDQPMTEAEPLTASSDMGQKICPYFTWNQWLK